MTVKHVIISYLFMPVYKLYRHFYQKKTKIGVDSGLPSCGEIQHCHTKVFFPSAVQNKQKMSLEVPQALLLYLSFLASNNL